MLTFVSRDEDLDDLIADLEAHGPCDIVAGGRTKERALERFAETLRFPDWFGHNLDALYELLDEHAYAVTGSGADWHLLWIPGRRLLRDRPGDYAGIAAVLRDVAELLVDEPGRGARSVVVYGPDPSGATRTDPDEEDPQ